MTDITTREPHALAATLRPQGYGRKRPDSIADPLIEPIWPGVRVFASVTPRSGAFWVDGESIDDHPELATALAREIRGPIGDGAVFDGYLTKQTVTGGVGVRGWTPEVPTFTGQMSRMLIGGRRNLDAAEKQREADLAAIAFDDDDVVNLVVVDLLWLDGQWLLDVPLLERKRVLDSILPSGPLVRPGPFVRPPIGSWIGSWRAQGFRGLTFKAANSRYRPGEVADDWAQADMPRR